MEKQSFVDLMVKKTAYNAAEKSANRICILFFHQPKLPEAVKKLRKF